MMGQILKYRHKRKRVILIADFICGLLILLFAYTAFSKLMEFEKFKHALSEAPLISNYSTFFAAVVPVGELIIVLLLARPQTQKTGLLTATGLLSVFTIYLVLMVFIDPDLPCSCGGVIQQLSWKQHIVFNLFFIGLGITGIYFQRNRNKEDQGTNVQST
jgi:drug/metabolite transporter (DMT)-like permease